jgi:hypothetical protein
VAFFIGCLGSTFCKIYELIAEIDKSGILSLTRDRKIEKTPVKGQRLGDIADLQSDMIDTDGGCFGRDGHVSAYFVVSRVVVTLKLGDEFR